jgi:hypothetical protein
MESGQDCAIIKRNGAEAEMARDHDRGAGTSRPATPRAATPSAATSLEHGQTSTAHVRCQATGWRRMSGGSRVGRAQNKPLHGGRCRMHGGLSTGPRTQAGKAAIAESNRRRTQLRAAAPVPTELASGTRGMAVAPGQTEQLASLERPEQLIGPGPLVQALRQRDATLRRLNSS